MTYFDPCPIGGWNIMPPGMEDVSRKEQFLPSESTEAARELWAEADLYCGTTTRPRAEPRAFVDHTGTGDSPWGRQGTQGTHGERWGVCCQVPVHRPAGVERWPEKTQQSKGCYTPLGS